MVKLDLAKAEEPEIKLAISVGSQKKQESFRKTSTSPLLTLPRHLVKATLIRQKQGNSCSQKERKKKRIKRTKKRARKPINKPINENNH